MAAKKRYTFTLDPVLTEEVREQLDQVPGANLSGTIEGLLRQLKDHGMSALSDVEGLTVGQELGRVQNLFESLQEEHLKISEERGKMLEGLENACRSVVENNVQIISGAFADLDPAVLGVTLPDVAENPSMMVAQQAIGIDFDNLRRQLGETTSSQFAALSSMASSDLSENPSMMAARRAIGVDLEGNLEQYASTGFEQINALSALAEDSDKANTVASSLIGLSIRESTLRFFEEQQEQTRTLLEEQQRRIEELLRPATEVFRMEPQYMMPTLTPRVERALDRSLAARHPTESFNPDEIRELKALLAERKKSG